jgi:hypothetical protein
LLAKNNKISIFKYMPALYFMTEEASYIHTKENQRPLRQRDDILVEKNVNDTLIIRKKKQQRDRQRS